MNRFGCDVCGADVSFEDNTVLIRAGEKIGDFCPRCAAIIEDHIESEKMKVEPMPEDEGITKITKAKELLRQVGYTVTKKR